MDEIEFNINDVIIRINELRTAWYQVDEYDEQMTQMNEYIKEHMKESLQEEIDALLNLIVVMNQDREELDDQVQDFED
jgi:hypothetical protein